jgi:hypothetical protein
LSPSITRGGLLHGGKIRRLHLEQRKIFCRWNDAVDGLAKIIRCALINPEIAATSGAH